MKEQSSASSPAVGQMRICRRSKMAGTAVVRSANGGAGCGGLYGYTGTHPDQAHGVFVGLPALVECSASDEGGVDVARRGPSWAPVAAAETRAPSPAVSPLPSVSSAGCGGAGTVAGGGGRCALVAVAEATGAS